MVAKVGGQTEAASFARLYMIPGLHHCGGGVGTGPWDPIDVLDTWVDLGAAPGPIEAMRIVDEKVVRTRPLCPHPQVARCSGTGSADQAASFTCAAK